MSVLKTVRVVVSKQSPQWLEWEVVETYQTHRAQLAAMIEAGRAYCERTDRTEVWQIEVKDETTNRYMVLRNGVADIPTVPFNPAALVQWRFNKPQRYSSNFVRQHRFNKPNMYGHGAISHRIQGSLTDATDYQF